jgi:hypothetical protein
MKILDEEFRNGQASYQRGIGLRAIFEQVSTLEDEDKKAEGASLALGYLDGIVASIRRIDNLLLMPAGPDR